MSTIFTGAAILQNVASWLTRSRICTEDFLLPLEEANATLAVSFRITLRDDDKSVVVKMDLRSMDSASVCLHPEIGRERGEEVQCLWTNGEG